MTGEGARDPTRLQEAWVVISDVCDLGLTTFPEFSHLCNDFDEDANACFACSGGLGCEEIAEDHWSILHDGSR